MKIAIIGSGIAGLSSAYFLRHHQCDLYEARPFLSLAGHGLKLDNGGILDIPLRVIHPQYYPHLYSLCRELNIPMRKLEHSGVFGGDNIKDQFGYFSINFFSKKLHLVRPKWTQIVLGVEFLKFFYLCHRYKDDETYNRIRFDHFIEQKQVSKRLAQTILYPLLSSICTCTYEELGCYPARIILEMMSIIAGPAPMERFYAGNIAIQDALSRSLSKVYLSTKIDQLSIHNDRGRIKIGNEIKDYDHIVIATEAHLVKNFLVQSPVTENLLELLERVPYKESDTIVHQIPDSNRLIKENKSLHYQAHPLAKQAQASIWLNKVEPHLDLPSNIAQTWNPIQDHTQGELQRTRLNRALVTIDSYRAVQSLRDFHHPRVSLAGSYLAKGVPLLEGGVESASRIKNRL
jgi:predicted NAD/FAD-binding protein